MSETEQVENSVPEPEEQAPSPPLPKGPGALLREERERRGLGYREVADRMRLRPHMIRAIEEEHWETLPPAAFVKGFLRSYARLLDLDEKIVVDLYSRMAPADVDTLARLPKEPAGSKGWRIVLSLCILGVVAALVYLWRGYVSPEGAPKGEERTQTSVDVRESDRGAFPREAPRIVERAPEPVSPATPEVPQQPQPTPAEVPGQPAESSVEPESLRIPPGEEEGGVSATESATVPGEHSLRGVVSARTWVRIQIDDQEPREYMFQPGHRPEWKARSRLSLFIGNAGGIDLEWDGRRIPKLGMSGQVVRLRLPEDFRETRTEE